MYPGQVVGVGPLADALWGEHPPASSGKLLQGCVMRLRKALGAAAIETVPHGYRLVTPPGEVDAVRFERLLARGRELLTSGEPDRAAYLLEEALTLWRGPALPELADWDPGMAEARRLEELRLDAQELRLEAKLQTGRHREMLGTARSLVEEAPLRERRWALLALAQYQTGRQAEALRTLGEVRTLLARELGLDPGADLLVLEQAILRQDPSLVADAALPEPRPTCPWRGLVPYDVGDAEDFFGRGNDVAACRHRLTEVGAVTVVGPSGSGKSSLVRAGLAAGVKRDGGRVVVITPGPHPADALAALRRTGRALVLVVDQCEEAVGLCTDPAERAGFFTALTEYAERAPLILAVRADRLGDLSAHPGFTRLVERSLYLLNPMTAEDLRAAIEGPARVAGLRLEVGLVDLLVREVEGEPGALPLLSHALRATWERREANTLTVAGYRESGGVRGAVAQSAEAVYQQVPADERRALRDLLLRLVAPNPEGDPMRSRVPRRLVAGTPYQEQLIETLVAARLVTSDDGVIELAHEALARAWPRLRDWLDDDAEGQRILRHLVVAADTWEAMGRPDSELYRGNRLAHALEWREQAQPDLTPTEREFLDAGRQLADVEEQTAARQAQQQKRVNRRLRGLLAGVAFVTIGALIAATVAINQRQEAVGQRQEAVRQRNEAAAAALAAASRDVASSNAALALALATESSLVTPAPLPLAAGALAQARLAFDQSTSPIREPLAGHGPLAFSPHRELLAFAGSDATIRLWNAHTGDPVGELRTGHTRDPVVDDPSIERTVSALAFSPTGDLLASGGADDTIRLWNPHTGDPVGNPLTAHTGLIASLAFSPDGALLASAGFRLKDSEYGWFAGGTVRLWETATGDPVGAPLHVRTRSVWSVAFSPDGELLASVDFDGAVRLWDPDTGDPVRDPLRPPRNDSVESVVFSPDGQLVGTSGTGGGAAALRWWNLDTGDFVAAPLRGRDTGAVHSIALSPSGDLLATGADGTVRLWDPDTGRPVGDPLRGHTGDVDSLAFSPSGDLLASADDDGTVRLWGGFQTEELIRAHEGSVGSLAFSPDGDLLATAGDEESDPTVRLWDTATRDTVGEPIRHPWGVSSVAFSPDGQLLATAGFGGMVRLWDPATGDAIGEPIRHPWGLWSVAFSPDGQLLASAGWDGTIRLWNPATGHPMGDPLRGHTPDEEVRSVAFSPDGDMLASASSGGMVRLWDPATGDPIRLPMRHLDGVSSVLFSPDGRLLASAGWDGTIRLWDPATSDPVGKPLRGHTRAVLSLAFSSDGDLLVSGSEDDTIRLWDPGRGDAVGGPLTAHKYGVLSVAMSPGEHLLASAGGDGKVRLWDWDVDHACQIARKYVNRTQLEPYLPPEWRPSCPYTD
jgi:WD40 repeat protein/DNA-binding SARP family transcriptional activator